MLTLIVLACAPTCSPATLPTAKSSPSQFRDGRSSPYLHRQSHGRLGPRFRQRYAARWRRYRQAGR